MADGEVEPTSRVVREPTSGELLPELGKIFQVARRPLIKVESMDDPPRGLPGRLGLLSAGFPADREAALPTVEGQSRAE